MSDLSALFNSDSAGKHHPHRESSEPQVEGCRGVSAEVRVGTVMRRSSSTTLLSLSRPGSPQAGNGDMRISHSVE